MFKIVSTFCILSSIAILLFSFAPATEEGITVTVSHLRSNKGHVLVSLFKDEAGFPAKAEKAFRKATVNIINKEAVITFSSLPAGNYAIAILHDENDDMKMNTNFPGIPKEGYGFSNNVMGIVGSPSFNKASFKHQGSSVTYVTIRTRY
ncbi:MAG TPA: DUF2141 domain-containing protein [Chitinophagaceae bacterium]